LRIKSRRGPKKAALAVATSMLTAIYFMLRDGTEYHDLGPDHFDKLLTSTAIVIAPRSAARIRSAPRST